MKPRKGFRPLLRSAHDDYFPEYAPADPSRLDGRERLWQEVVRTAWRDLFGSLFAMGGEIGKAHDRNKREAARFLLDTEGLWRRSREDVCELIAMNPDKLRAETLRTIQVFEGIFQSIGALVAAAEREAAEEKRKTRRESKSAWQRNQRRNLAGERRDAQLAKQRERRIPRSQWPAEKRAGYNEWQRWNRLFRALEKSAALACELPEAA